ncbi:MAG: uncharacterized protein KVP18_003852 [Porospora cf. gigantea A]|uniref:uncharacterized protein n=1 Tax=Porospora cf. gigantea A TaxID=2853593 RepID=UPI003559C2C1|nr:MAG: hypothetical protein KVP18_003852 [Porospora cf. gigantea A]
MGLFLPGTQVKLTNVAVVKLRKSGLRFEVACYKNRITAYRDGTETDLAETLQIERVFSNVSKGKFANQSDLMKAFNTADELEIAKIILSKGEIQVTEKERKAMQEERIREVAELVAQRAVFAETGLPITPTAAANLLKKVGFSVRLDEAIKVQSNKAVTKIMAAVPGLLTRTKQKLNITVPAAHSEVLGRFLRDAVKATILEEATAEDVLAVTILSDSYFYRQLLTFMEQLEPAGTVLMVNAHEPVAAKLEDVPPVESPPPAVALQPAMEHSPTKAEAVCGACDAPFHGPKAAQHFRSHCKSEWHVHNQKRHARGLKGIPEHEFEEISLDLREGFLTVD